MRFILPPLTIEEGKENEDYRREGKKERGHGHNIIHICTVVHTVDIIWYGDSHRQERVCSEKSHHCFRRINIFFGTAVRTWAPTAACIAVDNLLPTLRDENYRDLI